MVTITFSFKSQYKNGYFNPTFRSGSVQAWWDFLGRYLNVKGVYDKTGNGRIQLTQAATNGRGWMWTTYGSRQVYIHPSVNWGLSMGDCMSCFGHETCHVFGSNNHVPDPKALMHIDGGICDNMIPIDYPYLRQYGGWKGTLRPDQEPTALRDYAKSLQATSEDPYGEKEHRVLSSRNMLHAMGSDEHWEQFNSFNKITTENIVPRCGCSSSWVNWFTSLFQ